MSRKIRFVDLFAGMGGLRLGFEQGVEESVYEAECVFTSEIKPYAITVLDDNFDHQKFAGDITKIEAEDIPDFDVLLAGFPCQSFSYAGNRHGFHDTRGTLFFDVERILKEKRPEAFILENVEGLIKHDSPEGHKGEVGRTLKTILDNLKALGYHVDWKLLNSVDFGVPQQRKRVFIVGRKKHPVSLKGFKHSSSSLSQVLEKGLDTTETEFTQKLLEHYDTSKLTGKKIGDKRGGPNNIHSWDFELKGPVTARQKNLLGELLKNRRKKKWAEIIGIKWMDGMPLTAEQISTFSPSYSLEELEKDLDDLVEKGYLSFEYPKDLVREGARSFRSFREDLPKGYNIVTGALSFEFNRVLDPDDLAPTIVATDAKRIAVVDGEGLRPVSENELKGLFGFPKDFKMNVTEREMFDLMGNTVVVPVAREVTKKLLGEDK